MSTAAPPSPSPIRVLLCDDHRIVREGLRQVLTDPANGMPEIRVVAEATNGSEALQQVEALAGTHGVDVVLLDIAMPEKDGLDVLQSLGQQWPELPVLMFSTYPERQYAARCIQMGAAGYLHKSADPDDMVAAVRTASRGGRYLTEATAQSLAGKVMRTKAVRPGTGSASAQLDMLSHREHQVFRLITAGLSVGEIGAQLGLASNTVSTYRARILEKTGARNDVELALLLNRGGEA
jgi:DNA-binding NarL/FixJ family response regulator